MSEPLPDVSSLVVGRSGMGSKKSTLTGRPARPGAPLCTVTPRTLPLPARPIGGDAAVGEGEARSREVKGGYAPAAWGPGELAPLLPPPPGVPCTCSPPSLRTCWMSVVCGWSGCCACHCPSTCVMGQLDNQEFDREIGFSLHSKEPRVGRADTPPGSSYGTPPDRRAAAQASSSHSGVHHDVWGQAFCDRGTAAAAGRRLHGWRRRAEGSAAPPAGTAAA